MVGITQITRDAVTFTITLPICGVPFGALTEALNDAAQTMRAVYALAERGRVAFMTDQQPPTILKD